jgi:hypothetical protein
VKIGQEFVKRARLTEGTAGLLVGTLGDQPSFLVSDRVPDPKVAAVVQCLIAHAQDPDQESERGAKCALDCCPSATYWLPTLSAATLTDGAAS